MSAHGCLFVCVLVRQSTCVYMFISMYAYLCTCVCMCVCFYIHICVYAYTPIRVYACAVGASARPSLDNAAASAAHDSGESARPGPGTGPAARRVGRRASGNAGRAGAVTSGDLGDVSNAIRDRM